MSERRDSVLIIGFGNEFRGDDAAGPSVAGAFANAEVPHVKVLICHQVTPELAEPVAASRLVVFVDAIPASQQKRVRLDPVTPSASGHRMGHGSDPGQVLALSGRLFGHTPPAWVLSVPAWTFEHQRGLSPQCEKAVTEALKRLHEFLRERIADGTGLE